MVKIELLELHTLQSNKKEEKIDYNKMENISHMRQKPERQCILLIREYSPPLHRDQNCI